MFKTNIRITPEKNYGFVLHPKDGRGVLIIRLKGEIYKKIEPKTGDNQ
jgi:hypothetical protein